MDPPIMQYFEILVQHKTLLILYTLHTLLPSFKLKAIGYMSTLHNWPIGKFNLGQYNGRFVA